ncbi:MAG: hypothetical protein LBD41_03170 [Clostridiales Family XIII bacterium]|nr:hypothetical protein [Clostridiales Family XIII bacterium]
MAGKLATIIAMSTNLELQNRPIYKALKTPTPTGTNVRVQPLHEDYAYLVVEHKKSKDIAEKSFNQILDAFRGFGGKEFNEDILNEDSPEPNMAYMTNDMARVPPTAEEIWGPRS